MEEDRLDVAVWRDEDFFVPEELLRLYSFIVYVNVIYSQFDS